MSAEFFTTIEYWPVRKGDVQSRLWRIRQLETSHVLPRCFNFLFRGLPTEPILHPCDSLGLGRTAGVLPRSLRITAVSAFDGQDARAKCPPRCGAGMGWPMVPAGFVRRGSNVLVLRGTHRMITKKMRCSTFSGKCVQPMSNVAVQTAQFGSGI